MNKLQLQKNLLQETKYSKWYLNIIEKAQSKNRVKLNKSNEDYVYYENHHILPKTLFKKYKDLKENPWNGVLLTAREHFICHICLAKHYKSINYTFGESKMSRAIDMLSKFGKYSSNKYSYFKINLAHSEETKEKMSISKQNISDETRKKMQEANIGEKNNMFGKIGKNSPNYGRTHTVETKEKMSISKQNISDETRNKMSVSHSNPSHEIRKKMSENHADVSGENNPMYDKHHSVESKKRMSLAQKGEKSYWYGRKHTDETKIKMRKPKGLQKRIICPHCGKESNAGNYSRWHGDNCKLKR